MYIYNVTINVETEVLEPWLKWMQEIHIPDMLKTGKFTKARMCRVMVEEETGGVTYAIQYSAKNKEDVQRYYAEDAEAMRKDGMQRFPNKFFAFRTEMEVVDEQEA